MLPDLNVTIFCHFWNGESTIPREHFCDSYRCLNSSRPGTGDDFEKEGMLDSHENLHPAARIVCRFYLRNFYWFFFVSVFCLFL